MEDSGSMGMEGLDPSIGMEDPGPFWRKYLLLNDLRHFQKKVQLF